MDITGLVIFTILFVFLSVQASILWLKPEAYLAHLKKRGNHLKSWFPFLPDFLTGWLVFFNHRKFNLMWARVCIALMMAICLLGIFAAVHGPK